MRDFATAVFRRWYWFWLLSANLGINVGGAFALTIRREYAFAFVLLSVSCVWGVLMRREWRSIKTFSATPTPHAGGTDA